MKADQVLNMRFSSFDSPPSLQAHLLHIGLNPAAILINDDLSVFFDEAAALHLRQKVKDCL